MFYKLVNAAGTCGNTRLQQAVFREQKKTRSHCTHPHHATHAVFGNRLLDGARSGSLPARCERAAALRAAMEKCQAKIGKLTATLGLNSESVAAKYIVNEIEKLDIEYNSLRKRMLSANAVDRKNALNMKNAMEKREDIIRLLNDFDNFTPNERNEIAKDVLKECVWDGDTLFLTL